jgi:Ni,Fe-hydrogenase III large subunit
MAIPTRTRIGPRATVDEWRATVLDRVRGGARFGGMYASGADDAAELTVLMMTAGAVERLQVALERSGGALSYPALSPDVPAALWYEQALHDLSGVVPAGHPRLDPLLLPLPEGQEPPRPGHAAEAAAIPSEDDVGPADVGGHVFTLPFGPVRSGVMESLELLIETPGEDIPHLNIRPHYKHRGIAKEFERCSPDRGVLVAERVEGVSSVAHALAYCHAVEAIAGAAPPRTAALLRVIHAELERIANHLDVTMRLCDAAGLAVATARFGWHKETVLRLVSRMCGSRFGRGVIVPGGVAAAPRIPLSEVARATTQLVRLANADVQALEGSASFLDRLRTTGPLATRRAHEHGALGPVGRGSGFDDDDRRARPYDGYAVLPPPSEPTFDSGDALARARIRWHEIRTSRELVHAAVDELGSAEGRLRVPIPAGIDGFAAGWSEAAQGEALYGLEMSGGTIRRCFARSASFHNMVLFQDVWSGDIFTDLPFTEASFGLSYAGISM